jgi:hypothetical protein
MPERKKTEVRYGHATNNFASEGGADFLFSRWISTIRPIIMRALSIYGSTALVDLRRFFSFLILYTVGRSPWMGDQLVARPLHTQRTQTQNRCTQTSMPRVGFEPTNPVFERAKTVHASEPRDQCDRQL